MVEGVVFFFYFLAHFIRHFPKFTNLFYPKPSVKVYTSLIPPILHYKHSRSSQSPLISSCPLPLNQNIYTLKPHNLYSPQPQISSPSAPNAPSITPSYQEIPSMNIALSLSPITSLDTHFPSSPITPPSHSHKKIQPYNHSLHSTKCVITTKT